MKNKTTSAEADCDLPYIDATAFYDTRGAAAVLGKSETQLRQWRHRGYGPKYMQTSDGGRCQYLGSWLILFRQAAIVEPSCTGGDR